MAVEDDKIIIHQNNEVAQLSSPMNLIELAIKSNVGIEQLEKLMQLKERWDKEQSRKAYLEAMAKFQSECPPIKRKKEGGRTNSGVVAYRYAPLEDIIEQTKEARANNGFSHTFDTPEITETHVKAKMRISHIAGHTEEYSIAMPYVTKTGVMSDPQVLGATVTYARRYVFCNAFGIATADDDTDAITPESIVDIEKYIEQFPPQAKAWLSSILSKITKKSTLNDWILTIPTQSNVEEFKPLVAKLPPAKQDEYWLKFVQQNQQTVRGFLDTLNNLLNKSKEK